MKTDSASGLKEMTLFLCGDVMTGRGIDQVLPHPVSPEIYEPYVKDAREYVELAERVNGPVPDQLAPSYIWGASLAALNRMAPDFRIINLETAVTVCNDYWQGKGINYRMNPANIGCITAAGIDCCVLANNHVLDWGYAGLEETLSVLDRAGLEHTGAGKDRNAARKPVILEAADKKGRVIVFSFGFSSSGIPASWAAGPNRAGVNFLPDCSESTVQEIAGQVRQVKKKGDIVVASVHWGGNWGYDIAVGERDFAHRLVDEAEVDVFHGHSSHHFKGLEVYRGRPVIYGCGDFINDYEGIRGHKGYRDDLCLMYFPVIEPAGGRLQKLYLTPMQIKRFQLTRPAEKDLAWVEAVLNREGRQFGTSVAGSGGDRLELQW